MDSPVSARTAPTRNLALVALAAAMLALVFSGYSLILQSEQKQQLEAIRRALERTLERPTAALPMQRPPPALED